MAEFINTQNTDPYPEEGTPQAFVNANGDVVVRLGDEETAGFTYLKMSALEAKNLAADLKAVIGQVVAELQEEAA